MAQVDCFRLGEELLTVRLEREPEGAVRFAIRNTPLTGIVESCADLSPLTWKRRNLSDPPTGAAPTAMG